MARRRRPKRPRRHDARSTDAGDAIPHLAPWVRVFVTVGMGAAIASAAMRPYLAIDVYLDVVDEAPARRRERSLRAWLDAIARYPRQLAEEDPAAYFEA